VIHEVRIYEGDGKLKKIISAKKANKMFWDTEYGILAGDDLRTIVCRNCQTEFETRQRRKIICTTECAYQEKLKRLKREPLTERPCDWCDAIYLPISETNRFCTPKCHRKGVLRGVPVIGRRKKK
jgi:hypothetical protein